MRIRFRGLEAAIHPALATFGCGLSFAMVSVIVAMTCFSRGTLVEVVCLGNLLGLALMLWGLYFGKRTTRAGVRAQVRHRRRSLEGPVADR